MRYTEFSLIEHIKNSFASIVPHGVCGIGDDCAVEPLDEKNSLITTTDMLVEDVHFLRSKISAFSLGRKAVAVNLSDVAAMGGHPKTLFLSLALPQNTDPIWLDDFILGMRSWGVPLLGGDTTKSLNSLIINIVVQGIVPTTNLKLRSGAKVGDTIFVSDTLGKSAAGLLVIQ
ncbi:MAG: thiamine-phosphate kinase, partial [Mucinivorans sp.]